MITYREYCKNLKEDWGTTSPIPKETYKPVDWKGNFLWVDLGLPSGTLWADINLNNPNDGTIYWTWDDIMKSEYKDYVPTKKQIEELNSSCKWMWSDKRKGMVIKGRKNGNEIFLPADGFPGHNTSIEGLYWTSNLMGGAFAYDLYFNHYGEVNTGDSNARNGGQSVRLVKKK